MSGLRFLGTWNKLANTIRDGGEVAPVAKSAIADLKEQSLTPGRGVRLCVVGRARYEPVAATRGDAAAVPSASSASSAGRGRQHVDAEP